MSKLESADRRDRIRMRTIKGHYTRSVEIPEGHIIHPGGCSIQLVPNDFAHYSAFSSGDEEIIRESARLDALSDLIIEKYAVRDNRQAPPATQQPFENLPELTS